MLSRGLTQLFDTNWIRQISHPNGCSYLTHVLYADDIFVLCRGHSNSLSRLRQFQEDYGSAFGQLVSKDKSMFFSLASFLDLLP